MLGAAYALLAERGLAGVIFEGVAERAGVGNATLYRRWPDRAALAVDAFFARPDSVSRLSPKNCM